MIVRRDIDESDFESKQEYLDELKAFNCPVDAPLYPWSKDENWWVIIGDSKQNKILAIKKITNMQTKASITQSLELDLENFKAGSYDL